MGPRGPVGSYRWHAQTPRARHRSPARSGRVRPPVGESARRHRRGRDRERGSCGLARPARRSRPQAGSPRRPADDRGAAARSRRRPQPPRDRDAARLVLAAAAEGLPWLQRSAGGQDRPRRRLRLRRGRRQRRDLRDRPRQANDRGPRLRRPAGAPHVVQPRRPSALDRARRGGDDDRPARYFESPTTARRRPHPPTLPRPQHRLRTGRPFGLGQFGACALCDVYSARTGKVVRVLRAARARRRSPSRARGCSSRAAMDRPCRPSSGARTAGSGEFRCRMARSTSPRSAVRS